MSKAGIAEGTGSTTFSKATTSSSLSAEATIKGQSYTSSLPFETPKPCEGSLLPTADLGLLDLTDSVGGITLIKVSQGVTVNSNGRSAAASQELPHISQDTLPLQNKKGFGTYSLLLGLLSYFIVLVG